jgi:hypothetical protein
MLLAAIVCLHGLFYWWVERWTRMRMPEPSNDVTYVTFVSASRPPPPMPRRSDRREAASVSGESNRRELTASAPPDMPRMAPSAEEGFAADEALETPAVAAQIFRADGSIAVPAQVESDLAAVTRADRAFEFQPPGVMQARSFAQRPAAIEYRSTRFEKGWVEEKDPLSEALEKAVEKTTATVKIPVPHSPGTKIVCQVSLLAMGGSCGIVNNGQNYLVVLNDPETLNAEEDKQCRDWWDEIVATKSPTRWRELSDRYAAECRKPLEDDIDPPAEILPPQGS